MFNQKLAGLGPHDAKDPGSFIARKLSHFIGMNCPLLSKTVSRFNVTFLAIRLSATVVQSSMRRQDRPSGVAG